MRFPNYVYLIEAENGLVKIGCARFPHVRLQAVRLHSPIKSRLIAQWHGEIADERELHKRFESHRSHAEWFVVDADLRAFVEERRGEGLAAVEPWSECGFLTADGRRALQRQRMSEAHRKNWSDPAFRERQLAAMHGARRH